MADNPINIIIAALKDAGYDPKAQLTGYLLTGNESFITHRDGARDMIHLVDKEEIRAYLQEEECKP